MRMQPYIAVAWVAFVPFVPFPSSAAPTPAEMVDAIYKPGQNPQGSNPAPIKMDVSGEPWAKMSPDAFLPCFDKYGQFRWRDWPGKTKTDGDLKRAAAEEADDLAAHPGSADRDRFGGWAAGPRLKATGRFRTEKVDGKWWLVDPDGRLFWSFGPVRVSTGCGITPLDVGAQPWRRRMFDSLPSGDGPLDRFRIVRETASGKTDMFNFSAANLFRKYGEGWFDAFADLSHRRLRSWGMNTVANASDDRICRMDWTPYAVRVMLQSRPIEASAGLWNKFCDPFDPSFSEWLRKALAKYDFALHDPWCIGFFIDNEILWGKKCEDLALWVLSCPDGQPAKVEFLQRLAAKGVKFDKGDLSSVPQGELRAFTAAIIEKYFAKVRREIKAADPDLLYLGCRFAGFSRPPWAVKIAARYCDVLSFNVYRDDLVGWTPGAGIDAPILVGEFHFGAHDRGLFGSGQRNALTQEGRAAAIGRYVGSALAHPLVVGVHWHQYSDQPASGRFDGEHFQVGLTDICDRPYPETIRAVRDVGYGLYGKRFSAAKNVKMKGDR